MNELRAIADYKTVSIFTFKDRASSRIIVYQGKWSK